MRRTLQVFALALLVAPLGGCDSLGSLFGGSSLRNEWLLRWNQIATDASGLDHTPPAPTETRIFAEQAGPTRSSRALAIVHIAMFDAANAIVGGYQSYTRIDAENRDASVKAAVAEAAHDTLVSLFTAQVATFDAALAEDLDSIRDGRDKTRGIEVGKRAAAAILAMRQDDGANVPKDYVFSDAPGKWRSDPINPGQQPLGEEASQTKPFVLNSATQFRCPAPPTIDSAEYATAYNEVKALGGDGVITPTTRTADQTEIGIYWAYDGTPSLCAPPRMYNQIATQLFAERGLGFMELARGLALVNVSMADAGIAIWESKFFYNYWRPVTGIRESDPGTGPSGMGDGNAATVGDPAYVPLCAPASNLTGANFTPPFPAYPSGHAGFGGALFQTLRNVLGTDDITFTFVSDELNGVTKDNQGNTRPLKPRTFTSLSQAEEENGQSRIYLGIHWSFDKTEGIALGRKVADHVGNFAFQRVR